MTYPLEGIFDTLKKMEFWNFWTTPPSRVFHGLVKVLVHQNITTKWQSPISQLNFWFSNPNDTSFLGISRVFRNKEDKVRHLVVNLHITLHYFFFSLQKEDWLKLCKSEHYVRNVKRKDITTTIHSTKKTWLKWRIAFWIFKSL